jgi:hypothetical protein
MDPTSIHELYKCCYRAKLSRRFGKSVCTYVCDEDPDDKIYAYHVLHSNYMEVIFGIQALYSNSCLPADVAHMLHVPTSSYIYLTLSLSLPISLSLISTLSTLTANVEFHSEIRH